MDNNAPTSSSSTSNPSVLGHGGLKSSMLISRFSTRNLYELQLKEANHESMMQRFQLRKVSDIVATDNTSTNGGLLSPRSLALFTKRKTWVKLWHGMSSPLVPGSGACICHGLVMFGAILFQLFYLPFSVSYYPNGSPSIVRAGIALQLIYMVDLILNLNTAFVKKQKLVVSRISIARNHISNWFGLELVSAVPVGLAYGYQEHVSKSTLVFLLRYDACLIVLRLSRILLVEHNFLPSRVRSSKRLTSWLMYSRYSHLLGIAKLIWLVLLVAHYMACLWHVTAARHFMEVNISEEYVADFYYAIQLIQGQGGVTGTWEENVLSTIIILAGSLILATVFGNVAMLVSNFNANTTSYRQKMEGVFATMDKMGLPLKLRERVHQYYTHVWMEYESLDGDIVRFQRELAHTLRLEVGLYKYMNLVVRIPFWESCSPDFATQIILSLVVRVYLPDDYVVRKGDTGAEMFMINRGICEVSDPATAQQPCMNILASSSDKSFPETGGIGSTLAVNATTIDPVDNSEWGTGTILLPDLSSRTKSNIRAIFRSGSLSKDIRDQVYPQNTNYKIDSDERQQKEKMKQSLLYPGQAFGEMSLLMNYKRTANIRAATYVEVCIFNRQAFQNIISRYPEDRRRVLTTMLKSCIEKKEIPFPWDEVIDAVSERRRQNGTLGSSRLKVHTPVTSTEAAEALVDRIDVNKPDESIKYGFQTFHPDLKIPPLVGDNTATSDSASALRLKSQGARSSMTDDLTSPDQASSPAEPRVEDLKTTLSTMMTLMNSMAEKIERLEMHIYNRNDVCCMRGLEVPCAMHKNSGILNTDSNLSQYTIAEGREASYTNTRFRRSRRRNSTSSIISISGIQHQTVMGQDNKEETTDKTSYRSKEEMTDKASYRSKEEMTDKASYRSKLSQPVPGKGYCENSDNLVSVFSIQTDGLSVEATPGLEPTPVLPHDKLAMNIKSSQVVNDASFRLASVYHRGWLSRSTAPSSESRIADKLWRQHKGVGQRVRGNAAHKDRPDASLRTRSSFPSSAESLAIPFDPAKKGRTFPEFQTERARAKGRGSRVGIDELTSQQNAAVPQHAKPLTTSPKQTAHN